MPSQRHNRTQRFRLFVNKNFVNKNIGEMISLVRNAFHITSCKKCRAHSKYFQVQTHVQTACESLDLNMHFRSFDNGCKQLYE